MAGKDKTRRRGRPPLGNESGQRFQVTVPPRAAKVVRRHGNGSLSRGILWNPHVQREFRRETIQQNERRIAKLESAKLGIDRVVAAREIRGLREQNEELDMLNRLDEAWERRQAAYAGVLPQFA